ncbi:hypothetical protein CHS0354_016528 [Potamilus streckersoni]|uniref:Neurexin-4 n=1 Tax=Potamilus streckersoni TaxID=2493646 RepID=A0AAE0WFP7_9BIVA|nr:hypothetical protein CHS0354_016528 [Potamilus streckersoni]
MALCKESTILSLILCFLCFCESARDRTPFVYDDCRYDYAVGLGKENGKDPRIPDGNFWASSTSNDRRMPWMARLYDTSGAWTSGVQNSQQYLGVDLGGDYIVTRVATQGRQGSDEYVTEFTLEYSDDSKTWRTISNEFGLTEIYFGNEDGNKIKVNTLKYPIITRYLQFRPQRWNQFISMRVEVYGCGYGINAAKFTNLGYITYTLGDTSRSETDLITLRFRTTSQEGVIFYADGNQGDYISMELRQGYLYFRIDLGSTQSSRGDTQVVGGSMLDDGQWHDIIVRRNRSDALLVVDGLENRFTTNGLFYRLDLDKKIYLGGVDTFNKNGLSTRYNFNGCVDFVRFNGINMIRDARGQQGAGSFQIVGPVDFTCRLETDVPCSFPSYSSYIQLSGYQPGGPVRVKFEFRTYDEDGLLLYHQMNDPSQITVTLNKDGQIWYSVVSTTNQVVEDIVRNIDYESQNQAFTDGLWHTFSLYVDNTKVNVTVDRNSKVSLRALQITAGTSYFIGGYELAGGFRGCMRNIEVAAVPVVLTSLTDNQKNLVEIGTCKLRDRCTPNPCEHEGVCTQNWENFFCSCGATGYKGSVCHISTHPLSCEMYSMYTVMDGEEPVTIDPDGSGPLKPFPVKCNGKSDSDLPVETYIGHNSMNYITVNGYQAPNFYSRKVVYDTDLAGLTEVIERAISCEQSIEYKCNNSRLLLKPDGSTALTYAWWVGRTFQPMYYWGGAAPGSFKCACGLLEEGCEGSSTTCNCDSGHNTNDQGLLQHRDYLPVLEMYFGDTGTINDNKVGQHMLGELKCAGDNLLDNVVTFRKADATLEFATFEGDRAGDIWFQFKTTAENGVLIHNTGDTENDFIQVRLVYGDTMQFRYNVGNGIQVIEYTTINGLNNDIWHTVHVERNRKQAWLRVDNFPEVTRDEPQDEITRMLDLTSPLVVGAAVDYRDGYVGCMRGLRVNGVLMDMRGMVARGEVTYGVSEGCVGKCASNPCFNGGTCREAYSGYTCDCAYTPFRGWMCFREVGVNMQTNFIIRYEFDEDQGMTATDFKYVRVGFTTKKKQGILIQLRNAGNTEYISLEMNNNGGVKFFLDVGFERFELNTDINGIDLANGQAHEVIMRRENGGRTVILQVDNYAPASGQLGDSLSDSILNNPKYLFVGNNDTENNARGFEGCLFRLQIDNIYPLKRAFQDPRPTYVSLIPDGKIVEDMCGFEEVTQAPDPIEMRPYGPTYVNITLPPPTVKNEEQERLIIGLSVAFAFIIIVILAVIFFIYFRQKGDYETREAKGMENADNPDTAVVFCQTGVPDIPKRQEWFM